jgi:hypothetical protein
MLGTRRCVDFMFMGRSEQIHLYKHRDTRRYLNIALDGTWFRYSAHGYEPIGLSPHRLASTNLCSMSELAIWRHPRNSLQSTWAFNIPHPADSRSSMTTQRKTLVKLAG